MTNPSPDAIAPSLDLIESLAREAVATLPEPWRLPATHVVLRVEDFAPEEMLEAMDLNDPFELTGLYEGIPLTEKSVSDQALHPDMVWLFRRPILDEWAERGNVSLQELVSHVVIHELAHHFGWSDAEISEVDRWWE
ncbi:metallopeptidase family protein [Pseudomonas sp. GX19020]|uniref:metallopeptidase family protein n=1 Tax=Pseudomonadota TaxID=1224 RepID=UPI00089C6248|nr:MULTISPECIES: metallopeptidase family protein [Pseudomonadota]MCL4066670.1 metallopeptidase family protein [Pseudomonas sp. GX19020]SEB42812.1 Predicted Zn-dependent protease, minimal metalloprotease (MMP)-like domain [Rhodobacter sp. 24-YEA-8]